MSSSHCCCSSSSSHYSSLPMLQTSSRSLFPVAIQAKYSGSRRCDRILVVPAAVTTSASIFPSLLSSFNASSSNSSVREPKPNGSSGRTCNLLYHRCRYRHRRRDSSVSSSTSSSSSPPQPPSSEEEEEEEYRVLTAVTSNYNQIIIVDTPKARMLLLDSTHNVHSMLLKTGQKWTGSYWDEFASLPAIIPKGPVAILGLGGGTAAHLMLDSWPSLQIEGWEIDEILINKARDYFGLSDLESHTQAGGILHVHIGDALYPTENNAGRYAGIVIDLFCEGKVLAQLQKVSTWLELKDRLVPNGRFMVNCGGINEEDSDVTNATVDSKSVDGMWAKNSTIKVLCEAFPGQVSWKRMPESQGANYLALTGPLPDLTSWSAAVPKHLGANVRKWKLCDPSE